MGLVWYVGLRKYTITYEIVQTAPFIKFFSHISYTLFSLTLTQTHTLPTQTNNRKNEAHLSWPISMMMFGWQDSSENNSKIKFYRAFIELNKKQKNEHKIKKEQQQQLFIRHIAHIYIILVLQTYGASLKSSAIHSFIYPSISFFPSTLAAVSIIKNHPSLNLCIIWHTPHTHTQRNGLI